MKILLTAQAEKTFLRLPAQIQKKIKKQFLLLEQDFFYPSLHTKKMGAADQWEIRIDRHYRAAFRKDDDTIIIDTLGPHDEGLGKK
jgi:mRNA-degrading endonuclease RelE of RelBE toxin-antitoxin system